MIDMWRQGQSLAAIEAFARQQAMAYQQVADQARQKQQQRIEKDNDDWER